jgi:hypothetical protein
VSNSQKTWLAASLGRLANKKARDADWQHSQALPCSVVAVNGAIVTVKFEVQSKFTLPQQQIPIATSKYVREPIQVGDKGWAIPANFYLGGVSGQGGGTADVYPRGNLTPLVFQPISGSSFPSVVGNALVLGGPNGVVLEDLAGTCVLTLTPSGVTLKGNIAVTGNITATGSIVAGEGGSDQAGLQTHTHPSNGAPPTPGT